MFEICAVFYTFALPTCWRAVSLVSQCLISRNNGLGICPRDVLVEACLDADADSELGVFW